jgi:hypothetical protein
VKNGLGVVAMVFVSAVPACSQRLTWYEKLLLLQAPQNIAGVVVDDSGQPIAEAHIDHSDVQAREQLFSDDHGRFQIRTRAPALIVRKLGYDGQIVRIAQPVASGKSPPIRVVLHRATRRLAICAANCRTLDSPNSAFCLPSVASVQTGDQGHYEDTFVRAFTLPNGSSGAEMLHGAGPHWSLGIPYTGDVWESSDYTEHGYIGSGSDVIDARGTAPGGKHWRYLGRFGESLSYYEADAATAAAFDRVIDGACLAPKR